MAATDGGLTSASQAVWVTSLSNGGDSLFWAGSTCGAKDGMRCGRQSLPVTLGTQSGLGSLLRRVRKDPIARKPSAASAQLKKLLVFSEKLLVSWTRKEPGSKLARRLGG